MKPVQKITMVDCFCIQRILLKKLLFSCLLGFCFSCLKAQIECVPIFIKEFSDPNQDIEPFAIKTAQNGDIILAGRTKAKNAAYDAFVMKLTNTGNTQWAFTAGGNNDDVINGILSLKNGDFLLYGYTASFGFNEGKPLLIRISGNGTLLWAKQIGGVSGSADRIKAMIELPDNSLIGTFNTNDSSALSNAVVFKTLPDGTLQWSHVFDDGDDDCFSSLSFNQDTIFAAGYYTESKKQGVIVKLRSSNGSLISSQTVYGSYSSYHQEVIGLEVYNNIISYGLSMYNNSDLEGLILKQTDISGNNLYNRYINNDYDTRIQFIQRTEDNGFFILRRGKPSYSPNIQKFSRYGISEWGEQLQAFYISQTNYSMDTASNGGCVSVGFHNSYYPAFKNVAHIVKMSKSGYSGSCTPGTVGIFSDTGDCKTLAFTWQKESAFSLAIVENINPSVQTYSPIDNILCDSSVCIDKTPLTQGCSKTFRNEYASDKFTSFKDMLTTNDGGKIASGNIQNDALLVKLKQNGDVQWAKSYDEFYHTMQFYRVLKTNDNNFFVFGTGAYGGTTLVTILKIDNNGNVIWAKDLNTDWFPQLNDAITSPDNGFIIIMTGGYGLGDTHSYIVRFDAAGNVVWKKELMHNAATPVYRSVTVDGKYVYLASDTYDNYNQDKFDVDKLDYATGNQVWSNRYTIGNTDVVRINRIYAVNDTAYIFMNDFNPLSPFWTIHSLLLTKLTPSGKVAESFSLIPGVMLPFNEYYYNIESASTVTMSPSFDFVFTNRTVTGTDTSLNITRFLKNGEKVWSHNFPGMKDYRALNIHPQADGFLITGFAATNTSYHPNSFLLKVDSAGSITPSSTGDCHYEEDNLEKQMVSSIAITYPAIDSVTDIHYLDIINANILSQDVMLDAVPYCGISANCGDVGFKQKGSGCSLSDTLEYYLEDAANCDAAATWKYDTSFFKAAFINGRIIDLMPLKSGVSYVTALIEGNCSYTEKTLAASIAISASKMTLGRDTIICNNSTISLNAGAGYKTYLWQDNSTDSVFNVIASGKYYVTVTDNCGGIATDTINIQSPDLSFSLTNDTMKCNNDSVLLVASGGYSNYQWSPQYYLSTDSNVAVVKPHTTTRYYIQAERLPGCYVNDSVLVTVVTTPSISLGIDTNLCVGESVTLDAGTGFSTYNWSTGEKSEVINVAAKGFFYVTAYKNGCFSSDTINILNVYTPPSFSLGNDTAICPSDYLTYSFNINNAEYKWSNGSLSNTSTITQPGVYWLTITQNGCAASDTISILQKEGPVVLLGNDTTVCDGSTLLLAAYNNNATYLWQDNSTQPNYTVSHQGSYYATAMLNECVASDTIIVNYKSKPVFTLGADTSICTGEILTLQPLINGTAFYKWQDGSTLNYYPVATAGLYSVQVSNECGNSEDAITVSNGICLLQMPTAFTPNNDGLNDVFEVKYPAFIKEFHMVIYNRWGAKVFETTNARKGWDGMINSIPQNTGSYVWTINLTGYTDEKQTAHGIVTLIR